ncbi:MAG: S8 family serine peptidase [Cyclobacteriaceae bacterium]
MNRVLSICLFIFPVLVFAQVKGGANYNSNIQQGVVVVKFKSHDIGQGSARVALDHVKLKPGLEIEESKVIFKNFKNLSQSRTYSKSGIDFSLYREFRFDKNIDPRIMVNELEKLDNVEYAEPLYLYETHLTPNDPELSNQTYLTSISARQAWDISTGSSDIVVAIVDAGVDYEHPDLAEKIYINELEIPDNGIDDDNDGFIDNYYGWDFAGSDFENVVQDNDPIAKKSNIDHGTAVAGCAAADTDNGIGVAGMGFHSKYMALKCSADNDTRSNGSAFLLNTNEAVIYAADHGADVINMSYGGAGYSQFAQDVMTYAALEKDVVLISSAGNGGVNEINYPAAYDHVVSVANTQDDDVKAGSSTFGDWVDMSAPGTAIRTTSINNTYVNISGTSFSSPITAGAAALIRAHFPEYNQYQVSQLLIQTSDDIDNKNTAFAGLMGKGRLNMFAALTQSTPAIRVANLTLLTQDGEIPKIGDRALLSFDIINELSASSAQTKLSISETSGVAFETETTLDLGSVQNNETRRISGLELIIPDRVGFNESFNFSINVEDPISDFNDTYNFIVVVNPLITDTAALPYLLVNGGDFEGPTSDFKSGQLTGGVDIWELGTPTNHLIESNSGTRVWKTDLDADILKETYSCALQTPVFDFSDESVEYKLSFFKSMESEFCNASAAVQLQYSTDKVSWTRLGSAGDVQGTNWYNKSPTSACAIDPVILADQEGWLGNFVNEYTSYNVSFLAGNETVVFRFLLSVNGGFGSDNVINDDGFMLDDFQVEKLTPSASFYAKKKINYVGQEVEFEFLSNGATTFEWNFGDGNTSNERDPKHAYNEPGVYDVSLSITGASGDADSTLSEYILVLPNLEVPFTLEDGGDFENNTRDFGAENVSGSGFFLGASTVSGKQGTASGSSAWVIDPDESLYEDDSEAYLYTPVFNFALLGKYVLGFKANFSFETAWDGFIVEYSTNRGATWLKLNEELQSGWYNTTSDPQAVFGAQVPIFSGSTGGRFDPFETDVSFLGGKPSVTFRIAFKSDGATVDAGMAIDDFTLSGPVPGEVTADIMSTLSSGVANCDGQVVAFEAAVGGSVKEITWDFGEGADPLVADGIGPHEVTFVTGVNEVKLFVTDDQDNVTRIDSTVITDPTHTAEISAVSNGDGTVTLTASQGDAYQWYFNREPIEGATNQTYLVDKDGEFSVEVMVGQCIGSPAYERVTVTGLIDNSLDLVIYPNPVMSELMLSNLPDFNYADVNIYEISGKRVAAISIEESKPDLTIDVGSLNPGIYLIEILTEEKGFTRRFVKR